MAGLFASFWPLVVPLPLGTLRFMGVGKGLDFSRPNWWMYGAATSFMVGAGLGIVAAFHLIAIFR